MQLDSIKTRVESAYGVCNQRLKLEYDGPLSNYAFNFNLCHYTVVESWRKGGGRSLHSSTFQLNLSRFPLTTRGVSHNKALTLSRKVDECKPLGGGIVPSRYVMWAGAYTRPLFSST